MFRLLLALLFVPSVLIVAGCVDTSIPNPLVKFSAIPTPEGEEDGFWMHAERLRKPQISEVVGNGLPLVAIHDEKVVIQQIVRGPSVDNDVPFQWTAKIPDELKGQTVELAFVSFDVQGRFTRVSNSVEYPVP